MYVRVRSLSTPTLLVDGIQKMPRMLTMSTLAMFMSFAMQGVQCFGRASCRWRLHYQRLRQSTSQALRETLPMSNLMREMDVIFPLYLPRPKFVLKVCEDNQSCIAMTNNPKFTRRTKHIAIKYHHFRKHVKSQSNPDGFIEIEYCSTEEQLANIFTKPVRDDIFFKLRNRY